MMDFKVDSTKCIGCKLCVIDCSVNVLNFDNNLPFVNEEKRELCMKCQHCLAICPKGAISIFGKVPSESIPLKDNFPVPEEMETLIKGRRSIRKYKQENIDPQELSKLLTTSLHAPTGRNVMDVKFTVIDDLKTMENFRQNAMEELGKLVEKESLPQGKEFFKGIYKQWQQKNIDITFRKAPHMLVASAPKGDSTPVEDCMIALSYFELMATTMGIGTLWCGLGKWLINDVVPNMKSFLEIPEDHVIGYVMILGKPAIKYHRTVQKEPVRNCKIIN